MPITKRSLGPGRYERILTSIMDCAGLVLTPFAAAIAALQAKAGAQRLPLTYRVWDAMGVSPIPLHYYQPVASPKSFKETLWSGPLAYGGVRWDTENQLALLRNLDYRKELFDIEGNSEEGRGAFDFSNPYFAQGDAEIFFSIIRWAKPRQLIEVGCGHSTKIAIAAIRRNRLEGQECAHVCIEPYEHPSLEQFGASRVIRQKVEDVDLRIFEELEENDILFIDSSHVIRTGSDVCHEILTILPKLRPGVLVHFHDIYLPYEYPRELLCERRYFWTEQYLLHAFLAFNTSYRVLLALHYLSRHHRNAMEDVCPHLKNAPFANPASFWIRSQ